MKRIAAVFTVLLALLVPTLASAASDYQSTYVPAMNLAQWEDIAAHGTQLPNAGLVGLRIDPTDREPLSKEAIETGLTLARAQAANVTPDELAAAETALACQLKAANYAACGGPGYAALGQNEAVATLYELGWYTTHPDGWTSDEISAMNAEQLDAVAFYKAHFTP